MPVDDVELHKPGKNYRRDYDPLVQPNDVTNEAQQFDHGIFFRQAK